MENKKPFFLTTLFKRNPQKEFSEPNGWEENTSSNDTRFNGWDSSSPSSSISRPKTNQRSDKPPENEDYNGWGGESVSLPKSRPQKTTNNGWEYETHQDDKYNGWGPGSGSGGKGRSSADWSGESNSKPVSQEAEIDVNSLPIGKPTPLNKVESWAPTAPPIPDGGFGENSAANEGGNGGASCVVCWAAPVEGACVPCGHMGSCMACLREIESRNGTCPICRSKIDKVIRIYAISTE